jgi:AmmeMemoRadiSam system protein A
VDYYMSGDRERNYRTSVSYAAVVFSVPESTPAPTEPELKGKTVEDKAYLTDAEKRTLLDLAWKWTDATVRGAKPELPAEDDPALTALLKKEGGAFVTLTNRKRLRGCIGFIEPVMPLYKAVARSAQNAARDWRFRRNPIRPAEVKSLHLEISVLTLPKEAKGHEDIVIGKHGIILSKRGRSAVYLPKVPVEQGWTKEKTLTQLSLKAGLAPNDWQRGATFSLFEAHVFGEEWPK